MTSTWALTRKFKSWASTEDQLFFVLLLTERGDEGVIRISATQNIGQIITQNNSQIHSRDPDRGQKNRPALARFRIAAQAHSSVRSTRLQYSLKVPDARWYIARDRVCSVRISQAR
jgi:hypothetical protein